MRGLALGLAQKGVRAGFARMRSSPGLSRVAFSPRVAFLTKSTSRASEPRPSTARPQTSQLGKMRSLDSCSRKIKVPLQLYWVKAKLNLGYSHVCYRGRGSVRKNLLAFSEPQNTRALTSIKTSSSLSRSLRIGHRNTEIQPVSTGKSSLNTNDIYLYIFLNQSPRR